MRILAERGQKYKIEWANVPGTGLWFGASLVDKDDENVHENVVEEWVAWREAHFGRSSRQED